MDDRRKKAIRECHSDLRTEIIVSHILPKLHLGADGFLTDVEYATIKESSGNVEQVDQLIGVLLHKENKDFDHFCAVLKKEGCQASSNKLEKAAGLGKRQQLSCYVHQIHVAGPSTASAQVLPLLKVSVPHLHVPAT